jgi:hypothetical protein
MNRILKGLLASAAVAGVSYVVRNRLWSRGTDSTRERGETIYDNHIPVTE